MVRFGLRRSKRQKEEDESIDLNSIPTEQRKNTTPAGAAAAAAAAARREAAEPVDGPMVAGGPISPTSNSKAAALLRKMKRDKSPPPVASRDDFSMASGSTWTTKATELHSTTQNMHTDAAGNPVAPPNHYNIDVRDDGGGGEGRGSTLRRKIQKSALGGNKTDNTNISLIYATHGPQASGVLNLVLRENLPVPKLPTDVIVQVEAATVSLQDCIIRRGVWHQKVPLPATPGFDVVGTIIQVGEEVPDVSPFKVGDRVAALVRTGGNARYINIASSSLVKVPDGIDTAQAVCVVSTYMTAFQALDLARGSSEKESSLEGKKILVTGGNGPVGRAVIQLARLMKADAVYATAYGRDHSDLETMGAVALPFASEEWLPKVQGRMDAVIDGVCVDNYVSSHAALNAQGQLICIGMTSLLYSKGSVVMCGLPASARWASIKSKCFMSRTTTYELWDSFCQEPELFKSDLEYLFGLVKARTIKPAVSKLIALSEVADAQDRIESGTSPPGGQIVCLPWKKFVYVTSKKHKTDTESVVTPKY